MIALLLIIATAAPAKPALTDVEQRTLSFLVRQDTDAWLQQTHFALDYGKWPVPISSQSIAEAYAANELAADKRFKKKRFIVQGTLQSVTRDQSGIPLLVVGESDFATLRFPKSAEGELAALQRGQAIAFDCRGDAKFPGQAIFDDCRSFDDQRVFTRQLELAMGSLNDASTELNPSRTMVVLAVGVAAEFGAEYVCLSGDADAPRQCIEDLRQISKDREETEQMLNQAMDRLQRAGVKWARRRTP